MHIVCNFPTLLHTQYADVRLMCIGRRWPSYDVYSLAIGSNSQQLAPGRFCRSNMQILNIPKWSWPHLTSVRVAPTQPDTIMPINRLISIQLNTIAWSCSDHVLDRECENGALPRLLHGALLTWIRPIKTYLVKYLQLLRPLQDSHRYLRTTIGFYKNAIWLAYVQDNPSTPPPHPQYMKGISWRKSLFFFIRQKCCRKFSPVLFTIDFTW